MRAAVRAAAAAVAPVLLVLAGCGGDADARSPGAPSPEVTEEIDDDARWVGKTPSGARITAEAPADEDHPLVEQAEEYREQADAPDVHYVVVVYDNTEGTDTIDVFGGGRVVTEEGEELPVPHLASAGGVFEGQIEPYLPPKVQEEAHTWYAEFYEHQVVAPGAVGEVVLATTTDIDGIEELHVSIDDEDGEAELEPAS